MRLSDTAIKRPVFATVVSLVLVIFGLFSYSKLSVREYPDIDAPVVSVNTTYRGASAEIIESQITQVLEDAVSGIGGIKQITSSSREESSSISIEFNLNRDIDSAANDVRDRVSRAARRLPTQADPPTVAKTESDARPMMWLVLTSERLDSLQLTDYAERNLLDRFSVVDGVARVRTGGGRRYSMRIWLDKLALAARGLTVGDVEDALREQNLDLPSGRIESKMREFSVRSETSLKTPEEFRAIVLVERDDHLVRLGEVARVELGPENDRTELRSNGRIAVGIGIIRQSKSNALEVAQGVKQVLADLRPSLPTGMTLDISYDQSIFIEQSIREVQKALGISMALVVLVIFFFLRSIRATLIPAVAIPISILASMMVLYALDYSVNVLTLLALVLAIGLVVDDAIVVLENIHRRIELGEPPLLAAQRGTRQIGFAVIATTVVLVAVFLPISFLEGNTGRLFREFGIAVSTAVIFSSFVALTLTPMLCSKLLRDKAREGLFFKATEFLFVGLVGGYRWLLKGALALPLIVVALAVMVSGLAYLLYQNVPKEFAPSEDRGVFFISVAGPEGANLDYTRRYIDEISRRLAPLVEDGTAARVLDIIAPSFGRPGDVNRAFTIVRLKDWAERDKSQAEVVAEIFPRLLSVPGVRAFAISPASFGIHTFRKPVGFVIGGPSYEALDVWADRLIDAARQNPGLLDVEKDYKRTRPELRVLIDRDRAADLGVKIEDIGRTLETLLGERRVTTFQRGGKQYEVILRARPEDRTTPDDLSNIYVRSDATERLIPLASLVTFAEGATAQRLNRTDRLRSIAITASLAPGYTLAQALDFLDRAAAERLPSEARISYSGQSREFRDSASALLLTFGLALLVVFLALAAQFESFVHPVVIMISVPLAVTGALAAILYTGLTLNVYSQIGIIMLIGLTAKNAILIVEFANQLRDQGATIYDAVLEASAIRLRPILMTTISTALGALPLALATGAGAESRSTLGIVIIGGIGFSTILSLFVVPALYLLMARFTKPTGHIERALNDMAARHPARPEAPAAAE